MTLTELKPYQMEGAQQIRAWRGRALLADEMGLGKTLQALYWVFRTKKARPVVIVTPASLKYNWEAEARKHVGMSCEVLEGRKPSKRYRWSGLPILIINYEVLKGWIPTFKKLGVKVVVIDEAHYIKSRNSGRFKAVQKLVEGVPHVIAISGTPLTNRPAELWTTLHLLHPRKFPSFFSFAFRYCEPERLPWGWQFNGARNLDKLHRELKELCMIRRLKKDVLKDLPPKVRHVVTVDIKDRKEYDKAQDDFIRWLAERSPVKAERAAKSAQLVKVGYLMRLAAKLKFRSVCDWVDNFLEENDGKLVLFTGHRKMIDALERRYHGQCVKVDGSVVKRDRQRAVEQFQHDKRIRLFLGNVKAAGVGLTLTKASTLVFTDLPWTPGDLTQAEDRIHRISQKQQAMIYYLVARNTIEERLCSVLQAKQEILESVLDGKAEGASSELDILDSVLRGLRNTSKKKGK